MLNFHVSFFFLYSMNRKNRIRFRTIKLIDGEQVLLDL